MSTPPNGSPPQDLLPSLTLIEGAAGNQSSRSDVYCPAAIKNELQTDSSVQ